jgi:8-oxo-dGTP pyrophosphatase MutT (NUDIX family)
MTNYFGGIIEVAADTTTTCRYEFSDITYWYLTEESLDALIGYNRKHNDNRFTVVNVEWTDIDGIPAIGKLIIRPSCSPLERINGVTLSVSDPTPAPTPPSLTPVLAQRPVAPFFLPAPLTRGTPKPKQRSQSVNVVTSDVFLDLYNVVSKIVRMSIIPFTGESNDITVLLGRKAKSGKLTDIGGGCKFHRELPISCVRREILEEIGYNVNIDNLDLDSTRFVLLRQGDGKYYAVMFTRVPDLHTLAYNFQANEELSELVTGKWVDILRLPLNQLEPYTFDQIVDALRTHAWTYLV